MRVDEVGGGGGGGGREAKCQTPNEESCREEAGVQ